MKIKNVLVIPVLLLVLTAVACGNSKSRNDRTETVDKEVIKAPEFNADSAYQYIQVQADFGPRVPNTQAHKECGEYLAGQLEKFGAKVIRETANLCRDFGAKEVILYGSRAKETARKRSDIDIAVTGVKDFDALVEEVENLPTLYSVDMVNMDTCKNQLLLEDIRQYGRKI